MELELIIVPENVICEHPYPICMGHTYFIHSTSSNNQLLVYKKILHVDIILCRSKNMSPHQINGISGLRRWISLIFFSRYEQDSKLKGVLHPWALFLKILCIFSKNKATLDKVSYGFGQKCSKELKNHNFTSAETIVVKL